MAGLPEITGKNDQNQASGSELMNYQPGTTPIDFTQFLNIDDEQPLLNLNNEGL